MKVKTLLRPIVAGAAAVAITVGTAGCNTDPSAAAIVAGDSISIATLQDAVDAALANPQAQAALGTDRAGFTRTELGRLISNRVIAAAAAAHHITVTPTEVQQQIDQFVAQAGSADQLYQSAAQGGVPREALPTFIKYFVMEQKLADQLLAEDPITDADVRITYQHNINTYRQVHAAHILVSNKDKADQLLAEVKANPSRFGELARKFSTDTQSAKNGGDLGWAGPTDFVQEFSTAIFNAKPGSFLEVQSQFGWHVVHVIDVRTQPLSQVADQIRSDLEKTRRETVLQQTLIAQAHRMDIHVNPRYGTYDAAQQTVVPLDPADGVSRPSPTSTPAGPAAPVGP